MNEIEKAVEILKHYDAQEYFFSKDAEADKAFKLAISALEKQLTNAWIPCSERLPNCIGETILVTVPSEHGISQGFGSIDIVHLRDDEKQIFYGTQGKYTFSIVSAWQPLPQPYTEVAK